MFEPKFTLNFRILNILSSIERYYGKIQAEKLIPSLSLQLMQENQILATHYSTSIEGNPLSPQDVTNVVLGDHVPSTKSEKEVKNYFTILTTIPNMVRERTPLSVELIEKLHKILMEGIELKDFGKVRDGPVFVGHKTKVEIVVKHNPPFHNAKAIKAALGELFDWLNKESELHPILKAAILHHQFAYIHPFFDGNGRLARIVTTYYLLMEHYEVSKYFIIDDYYDIDRLLYSDCLHSADKGDETQWIEYFLEGIASSLQGATARINELKRHHLDRVEGEKRVLVTPREEEVLQIVIDKKAIKTPDIEKAFEVTRQQAHSLLASLVKKRLLKKYGTTKMSYYKLRTKEK
ncbi:MAG: Fic family protein [Candidatus Levyibacteriota bacterium]